MLDSCVRNLATHYLLDGTFTFDTDFIEEQIIALTEGGRGFNVTFFLANGPSQRQFSNPDNDSQGFGARISPSEFRARIQTDDVLRSEYQGIVQNLIPLLELAQARGVTVNIIPMLEDNLNDAAFIAMRDLTLGALPDGTSVRIGRNPCGGSCFDGNETGVPAGVFKEEHLAGNDIDSTGVTVSGGIVSNDGFDYFSAAVPTNPLGLTTLEELIILRAEAEALGNIFILWSGRRQGLTQELPEDIADIKLPDPSQRNYIIPDATERAELIEFLQRGL